MRSDGWPAYNFRGYEAKPLYPEYHDLVQTMAGLGADPEHGCGRALWEIDNRDGVGNGKYGTTMALMLLPFWTDGCIASMEGLYFEASGTTPYHFLTSAAMSNNASNPVRQLRYIDNDADVGVEHVQRPRHPLRDGHDARGGRPGGHAAGAEEGRHERAVAHLRVRRRDHRRAALRAAGGRQRPRR